MDSEAPGDLVAVKCLAFPLMVQTQFSLTHPENKIMREIKDLRIVAPLREKM